MVSKEADRYQKWLGDALATSNISQSDLARHLDIHVSEVNKMVTGKRRIRLDEVEPIATRLGCPLPFHEGLSKREPYPGVAIRGYVDPSSWWEPTEMRQTVDDQYKRRTAGVIDPRYPTEKQTAFELMNSTRDGEMRRGDVLICVSFDIYRKFPLPNDILIFRATRGTLETFVIVRAVTEGSTTVLVQMLTEGVVPIEPMWIVIGLFRPIP